jgi:hypothetical protein
VQAINDMRLITVRQKETISIPIVGSRSTALLNAKEISDGLIRPSFIASHPYFLGSVVKLPEEEDGICVGIFLPKRTVNVEYAHQQPLEKSRDS